MAPLDALTIIEHCKISPYPSPDSLSQTSLPLTFFDLLWLTSPSVQHLFFFSFPRHPHQLFPFLKHSLSLTLHHFYPLAGTLTWPQKHSIKPIIQYTPGDSVSLIITESTADFEHLIADYPRPVHNFHPLVPHLVPLDSLSTPILAFQITVFPNNGICIGFTVHHGVADGSTAMHFMKSWALICKSVRVNSVNSSPTVLLTESLPIFDRSVIKDPNGLEEIYLKDFRNFGFFENFMGRMASDSIGTASAENRVRATFTFTRAHIKKLDLWLARLVHEKDIPAFYTSRYVVTCAYVLECLIKARAVNRKTVQLGFATGCRTRLKYPIPALYFGNCIGICLTSRLGCDVIKGEDGFVAVCEGLGRAIEELEGKGGVLKGAEEWVKDNLMAMSRDSHNRFDNDDVLSNERIMIAGTLKLSFYDVDFGWGRPKKSEVISLEKKGAFSVGESGRTEGGVEVGLALNKDEMDVFSCLFIKGLKDLE